MKIEKLRLRNFGQFEDFEIVFNDSITNLIGINGAGKTTVGLTALWAGFKGILERSTTGHLIGERFRFITAGKKSLDVEITLHDETKDMDIVFTRHITKTTNTIKIDSSSSYPALDREYIENLFNVSFLSATHFSALTGKQQAAAMGIDTAGYDENLRIKKEDAKGYRRDIKKIGELVPVEECEKKDIKALQLQHKAATEHNQTQTKLTAQLSTLRDKVEDLDEDINHAITDFEATRAAHEQHIAVLNEERITASTGIKEFVAIEDPVPIEPIDKEIADIVESNENYFKYETYKTGLAEKEEFEEYLNKNLLLQKDIQDERRAYLISKSFGIKGLQIDEDGNLTKDDKLIREPYFSKGELEVLVARIAMALNPELKVRFIDNFELLDDDNQAKLINHLTKKGFQIITATVGKVIKDNKSVLLRECKKVSSGPIDSAVDTNEACTEDPDDFGEIEEPGEIVGGHPMIDKYDKGMEQPRDDFGSTGEPVDDDDEF